MPRIRFTTRPLSSEKFSDHIHLMHVEIINTQDHIKRKTLLIQLRDYVQRHIN